MIIKRKFISKRLRDWYPSCMPKKRNTEVPLGLLPFWQCKKFVSGCVSESKQGNRTWVASSASDKCYPWHSYYSNSISFVLVSSFSILTVYETFFGYYVTLFSFCQPPYVNLALNFYPQDCGTVKSFLASLCTSPQC